MARLVLFTLLATLVVFAQAKDVRKRIGDRCETNAECQASLGAGGNCTEPLNGCYQVTGKHCACGNRYREADGECHLSRSFSDPCETDSNCNTLEAVCLSGSTEIGATTPKSCQCEPGSHYSEEINMCLKPIRFNKDQCRYAAECQFFFGKMSQCSYNYNAVYTYRSYNDRREMKCMCTYGHHFVDGKCWRSSNFGRICSSNAQCITKNSQCNEIKNKNVTEQFLNRIFSSTYGQYNYNYRYGGYSSQDNSYISDTVNTCQCPQDSIYYEPYDECLRPSILNDSCIFSGQCQYTMGLYSTCVLPEGKVNATGTCFCNKGYFYNKGTCYKQTSVGGYCNVHEECATNKVATICENHRCKSLYESKSNKYISDKK